MGRELVRDRLEKRLGLELDIGRARIDWPYVLVVEKLRSKKEGPDQKTPLIEAKELHIGWGFRPRWRVQVYQGVLNIVGDADENGNPELFSRLSSLPLKGVNGIARVTKELRRHMTLDLRECSIDWLHRDGSKRASASGLSFHLRPVKLPARRMYHYDISTYNLVYIDRSRDHDIVKEWLSSDALPYVEIYSSGRHTSQAGLEFWRGKKASGQRSVRERERKRDR